MSATVQETYTQLARTLSLTEKLHLANLLLNELSHQNVTIVEYSDSWTDEDLKDVSLHSMRHSVIDQSYDNEERG